MMTSGMPLAPSPPCHSCDDAAACLCVPPCSEFGVPAIPAAASAGVADDDDDEFAEFAVPAVAKVSTSMDGGGGGTRRSASFERRGAHIPIARLHERGRTLAALERGERGLDALDLAFVCAVCEE